MVVAKLTWEQPVSKSQFSLDMHVDNIVSVSFGGRKFGRIHAGNRSVFVWLVIESTVSDKLSCMLWIGEDSSLFEVHQKAVQGFSV